MADKPKHSMQKIYRKIMTAVVCMAAWMGECYAETVVPDYTLDRCAGYIADLSDSDVD